MSSLYDTKESRVIDDKMLEKAVEEQGPQEQGGLIAKEEGLKYDKVTQLRLDYRNLSFNNIEVIEGLDTLVKLQDLSLFSNRISVIENLDALPNLHILLLGNNSISELDNVMYLRKFKKLCTLDLAGNPICKDENYKLFVAAYLSDLVYLDFRQLDEQTRVKAQYQYQNRIERIKHDELQEQGAAEAQKNMEQVLQLHKEAFVEYLNGPHLFNSMFADDVEASKLAHLSEVATLVESYQTQLEAFCIQIFEEGLTQQTQRQNEVECFFTCFRKVMDDNQQRGAQIVADFERSRRQVMVEMQQSADCSLLKDSIRNKIKETHDTLLSLEVQLVAQVEDVTKEFERNITEMVGGFAEYVQGIFAQCRDLENQHHEKVLEIAVETLEKVAKNELEEELPDDVQLLFVDKDTTINAVSMSHDTHLLKIDNREDELLTRLNGWKSALIQSIHDEEVKRNRIRISEIHKYFDYTEDQLKETLLPDY